VRKAKLHVVQHRLKARILIRYNQRWRLGFSTSYTKHSLKTDLLGNSRSVNYWENARAAQ
jgi:hypothetical protein